jgi:hypothetical protein
LTDIEALSVRDVVEIYGIGRETGMLINQP